MPERNSYIVVDKQTGKAVFEFWNKEIMSCINTDKYEIMTAAQYLPTLNNK